MFHRLAPDPFGLSSFGQSWSGFWTPLRTPECARDWDEAFGRTTPNLDEPSDWQFAALYESGRRIRFLEFRKRSHQGWLAAMHSARTVDTGDLLSPELFELQQQAHFSALRRQFQNQTSSRK